MGIPIVTPVVSGKKRLEIYDSNNCELKMFAAIAVLLVSILFGNCSDEKTVCKIGENCTMSCESDDIIDLERSTDCETIVVKLSSIDVWTKLKRYPIEKMIMSQNDNLKSTEDLFIGTNVKKLYLYQNNLTELKTGTFEESKSFETLALNRNKIKVLQKKSIPRVKLLYLHYNLIESVNADMFVNISHVKILRLSNNNIKKVTADSLMGLKADFLDLSYNLIEQLEDKSIPDAKFIKIDHNKLTSIDSKMFVNISNAFKLDVSYNRITHLSINSFSGMKNLTDLSLSNNLIASLGMKSIPTVKNLNLSYNLISFINTGMFVHVDYPITLDLSYNCINSTDFRPKGLNVSVQKDTCNLTGNDTITVFTSSWMIAVFLLITLILVASVTVIALRVYSRRFAKSATYYLKNVDTPKALTNVYEMS